MISSTDSVPGYRITESLGIVEVFDEVDFRSITISGATLVGGGKLGQLLLTVKDHILLTAYDMGANAIVGFSYSLVGRELEKSLLAYGTAVKCVREGTPAK